MLAVGDMHVENFGTWRDAEGRLVWGVNDFDEAAKMPYTIDLVRLAASAMLAGGAGHLDGRDLRQHRWRATRRACGRPEAVRARRGASSELRDNRSSCRETERKKFWLKFDPVEISREDKPDKVDPVTRDEAACRLYTQGC